MSFSQVVKHPWHHSAGSAGRCSDYRPARSVLLANCEGIGINQSPCLKRLLVACGFNVICSCLTSQVQRSWEPALVVYPILHGLLHRYPNILQIVPNLRTLAQVDIFPIIPAIVVAPVHYLGEAVHIVNFFRRETVRLFSFRERATAYAVDGPVIEHMSLPIESLEFHAVRVIWQEYASLPDYFHWSRWFQHLFNGNVGHVALTGRRQAAIEGHLELRCIPVPFEKIFRRPLRPHGMAARRPLANPKKFLERFHATTVIFLP